MCVCIYEIENSPAITNIIHQAYNFIGTTTTRQQSRPQGLASQPANQLKTTTADPLPRSSVSQSLCHRVSFRQDTTGTYHTLVAVTLLLAVAAGIHRPRSTVIMTGDTQLGSTHLSVYQYPLLLLLPSSCIHSLVSTTALRRLHFMIVFNSGFTFVFFHLLRSPFRLLLLLVLSSS